MNIIRNKKTFTIGVVLLASFILCCGIMLSPVFGNNKTGLIYAEDMFNSLSKGSSYFIRDTQKIADAQKGITINLTIKASSPTDAARWGKLYSTAGAAVNVNQSSVTINGDYGKILSAVVADSDSMYQDDSKSLEAKYGYEGRAVLNDWNSSLKKMDTALKANSQFSAETALIKVQQKALEPAYNYYGIEIKKVSDNKGSLAFLLIFYVLYTIWYGFGLYFLFDGLGIVATKPKKKDRNINQNYGNPVLQGK